MLLRRSLQILRQCSQKLSTYQSSTDVLIIGGGAMGSSAAYWLRQKSAKHQKKLKVLVVEKDITYQNCSTARSLGGIRQQFSTPENIQMSLFGANFIKGIKNRFGDDADVCFMPYGYLILANRDSAEQLTNGFNLQTQLGATNSLLTKQQLDEKFPWLNTSDIELGCLGGEKEGWFDPWALLHLLREGAVNQGAEFLQGTVGEFIFNENHQPNGVVINCTEGQKRISFQHCIVAAGAESARVATLANIGVGPQDLSTPLPVERRKRYVFRIESQSQNLPPEKSPFTFDNTGMYVRRDCNSFLTGRQPEFDKEPSTDNLDVDYEFFESSIWPELAFRIPAFQSAKVKSAWSGFYEFNYFDENGIIGAHPVHKNVLFLTGFSGHGIQQSPAAGLAIAELIIDGRFTTIDLSRFGFDRFITQKPVPEVGIY